MKVEFQSTHPSWGATASDHFINVRSDNFNPRTHRGVRHPVSVNLWNSSFISIHAPIVGCDRLSSVRQATDIISIHAPIVGCDINRRRWLQPFKDFNPRTHRGVRLHLTLRFANCERLFQSTHPSWGATMVQPSLAQK